MKVLVDRGDSSSPAVMRIIGEVDVYTASELRNELALHMTSRRDLLVDLSGVTFMDSTGLTVPIRAARQLGERGARLELLVDTARVARLGHLVRVAAAERTLTIHPNLEEARWHMSGGGRDA